MKYEILEKSNSVTEYFISSYHENFITYSPSFIIGDYFYSFFILLFFFFYTKWNIPWFRFFIYADDLRGQKVRNK